jgi:hypothetical protein
MDATGGLTFGLGTRKSEGNAIVGSRAVAYVQREGQACFVCFYYVPRGVRCMRRVACGAG